MGAKIGLQAMVDFPKRVGRVVLGGIGWGGAFRAAQEIAKALRGGPIESPVARTFYDFAKGRPSNDLEALAACILGPQPEPDSAALAKITNPVLVVVGDEDDIVAEVDRFIEHLPTAKLVTIAGRNHMSAVPAGEFKKAALEFLEGD
jgi:pimeloyl-ACP methyl ester carboxylesterase